VRLRVSRERVIGGAAALELANTNFATASVSRSGARSGLSAAANINTVNVAIDRMRPIDKEAGPVLLGERPRDEQDLVLQVVLENLAILVAADSRAGVPRR
jgi:hypothetical protein